ncbi:class I SAM-dependent methyltransferase [Thiomonas sp.]
MSPEAYLSMADTEAQHWWFTGRRKILEFVIRKLDLPKNANILEIGCGTGGNLEMLAHFGVVSALEMDATALKIATEKSKGRYDIKQGVCPDLSQLSLQKFDLICLFDVLEHIDQDIETIAEAKKLLADGGRILITVPAYAWLWSMHDEFLHHKRRYTAAKLRKVADSTTLRVSLLTYFNALLFPLIAVVRLKEKLLHNNEPGGTGMPPKPINFILRIIFGFERHFIGKIPIPFGVSLLAIFKK